VRERDGGDDDVRDAVALVHDFDGALDVGHVVDGGVGEESGAGGVS
jgi:hypothetical protein